MLVAGPATGATGRTAHTFDVSPTGESRHSIPIWVPPGTAGMQPRLALSYNSAVGDGLLGIGFHISGLSRIESCKRTIAQDGAAGAEAFNTEARYCLDGQRLRLDVGAHGQLSAEYRTEIETFSRVKIGALASGRPTHFICERKDGLIYTYGNTDDSRIEIANSTTVRVWALNRIEDRAGNYVDFTYDEDSTNGSYRPSEVRYTGNESEVLSPAYAVHFTYESAPRPDPLYGYFPAGPGTGEVNTLKRVDKVEVLHDTTVVRSYDVTWDLAGGADNRSRIASIVECAGADCLPATSYSWQPGTAGYGAESTLASISNPLVMDLNGDGRADLVYIAASKWRYRLGNTSGGFNAEVNTGQSTTGQTVQEIFEWEGDGRDDVLISQSGTWRVLRSNGSGFDTPINTGISSSLAYRMFDITGDGRHDMVRATSSAGTLYIYARLRSGSGFAAETLAYQGNADSGYGYVTFQAFPDPNWRMRTHRKRWDHDGDGREDFALALVHEDPKQFYKPYYSWTAFNSSSTPGTASVSPLSEIGAPWITGYQLEPLPFDANNDGLTDIIYAYGSHYAVKFSRGVYLTSEVGGAATTGLAPTISAITDYDGDGVSDMVVRNTAVNRWHVLRGTGTGLAFAMIDTNQSAASALNPRTGDIDGNGLPDLLWANGSAVYFRPRAGDYPDLLSQVTDSYGNTAGWQYESIAHGNYTKHADATFPEQDYAGPRLVVSAQTASDGIGGTYAKSFWYYGARLHLEGRGFEGFDSVRSQDSRNSLYARSYFKRTFPYTGLVFQNDLLQPNNSTLIAREQVTWAAHTYGVGFEARTLPYANQSTSSTYEVGGTYNSVLNRTVSEVNTVDSSTGTVVDTTTTVTEPAGANGVQPGATYTSRTVHVTPLFNDPTNWCIGRPQTTQFINSHNQYGGSSLTHQENTTWDLDGYKCRPTQVVEQPGDAQWEVTTALGYDSFGNVSSKTVTGSGMTARTASIDWGTTGQFPVSVTNVLSQTTQMGWDYSRGFLSSQTDPNGIVTSWQPDGFGRRTLEVRPDGTTTEWAYNDCSPNCVGALNKMVIVETTKAAGGATVRDASRYLDRFDRLIVRRSQTLSGAYSRVERQYDALGRVLRDNAPCWWTSCAVFWTTYAYDLLDRVSQVSRPLSDFNPTVQYTNFYYEGLTTRAVDALGKQSAHIANALGEMARTRDHDNHYKSFDYTSFGELKRVTDSAGNTLQENTYNIRGMLTAQTDMDRGAWTFEPNALGELRKVRDAKTTAPAWTTVMDYDALGRLISRQDVPEGTTSTWTWGTSAAAHNIGGLASLSGPGYSESYTYDAVGRPETKSITNDATYQFDYAYNTIGALDTLTYPVSTSGYRLKVQHEYQYGHSLRVKDFNAPTTVYWQANATDARGLYTDENLGSALQRIQGFDQVTGLPDYIQTGPGGNPTVQNLGYVWDGVGNVKERRDDTQSITEAFTYDSLHRLTSSTRNGSANLAVGYDALGNITSKTGQGTYTYHATRKHAVISTSGGGSYGYDANGNMTSRSGGTLTWYSFNLPNSITSGSSSSQFFYAPDGARYKQVASYSGTTETTLYVGGLLEKMTRSGVTEYRHAILAGVHTAIYTRRSDGTNSTYHVTRDHLGSASAVTDATGTLLVNESFSAFGERRGSNWTGTPSAGDLTQIAAIDRHGFTDHEHLDNLNLIHMNGRVYDPALGRFIQADPFIDGWDSTQGYNRYSYVKNNPLRFIDPSGFDDSDPIYVRNECETAGCGGSLSVLSLAFSFSTDIGFGSTRPCSNGNPNCFTPDGRDAGYATLGGHGVLIGTMNPDSPAAVGGLTDSDTEEEPLDNLGMETLPMGGALASGLKGLASALGLRALLTRFAGWTATSGKTVFKTGHYASRLEAAGVSVARAEALVAKEVAAMRGNMMSGSYVTGRMQVDNVLVEYRVQVLPNGSVSVGTIFPVGPGP